MKKKNLIKKLETLPNLTTLLRVPLGVLFIAILIYGYYWAAFIVYCIGALTDALDGYLARKLKQKTRLGGFLDATADRIFVILVIIGLVVAGKFNLLLIILIIFWVICEAIFGFLITKKIHKNYLNIVHRNSIRYAAFFLYLTIGGAIINFNYLLILVIITLLLEVYALIDYTYYYYDIKSKTN